MVWALVNCTQKCIDFDLLIQNPYVYHFLYVKVLRIPLRYMHTLWEDFATTASKHSC